MSDTAHIRCVERLPWFLNGTLDTVEHRQVEEHLHACADCRVELAATRGAFSLFGAHLPSAVLVGYAEVPTAGSYLAGEDVVERRWLEAHLGHCPECRDALSLARRSLEEMEGNGAADVEGGAASVHAAGGMGSPLATVTYFPRLGASGALADPVSDPVSEPVSDPGSAGATRSFGTSPRWVSLALAASLLLAMVSAGGWFTSSRHADARQQEIARLESDLAKAEQRASEAAAGAAGAVDAEEVETYRRTMEGRVEELTARQADAENRVAEAKQRIAELRRGMPAGGVVYFPLAGGDVVRSGNPGDVPSGAPARIELGQGDGVVLQPEVDEALLLGRESVDYRLIDAGGWVYEDTMAVVDKTDQGLGRYLALFVPAGLLAPGTATLEIRAGGEEAGRYTFQVER